MADGSSSRVVLIAMDGSSCANYAYDWYMKHLHRQEDSVILLNVIDLHEFAVYPTGMGDVTDVAEILEEEKEKAEDYVDTLTAKMKNSGLHGKAKQVYGRARDEILKTADEEHVTFIITGTRGMGKIRRTLLGSVSGHVLHHSHVPVFVCRHEAERHGSGQFKQS